MSTVRRYREGQEREEVVIYMLFSTPPGWGHRRHPSESIASAVPPVVMQRNQLFSLTYRDAHAEGGKSDPWGVSNQSCTRYSEWTSCRQDKVGVEEGNDTGCNQFPFKSFPTSAAALIVHGVPQRVLAWPRTCRWNSGACKVHLPKRTQPWSLAVQRESL